MGALTPLLATLKFMPMRSLPGAYGHCLSHRRLPPHEPDRWVDRQPGRRGVRRDARRLIAALGDESFMGQIAAELADFTNPVLLVWAADGKFFVGMPWPGIFKRPHELIEGSAPG